MSGNMPELGSKISLISKADIRYEGRLFTVDPNECTIALASVRSFGTEDRETQFPIAAQNQVYDYILFRGSDIKDIRVCNPTPPVPNDPAIMQMHLPPQQAPGMPPVGGQPPFQAPHFAAMGGGMMPGQQPQPFGPFGGMGQVGGGGMPGAPNAGLMAAMLEFIGGGSRSTTPHSLISRKSPSNDMGVQAGSGGNQNQSRESNSRGDKRNNSQSSGGNNNQNQQQKQQQHQRNRRDSGRAQDENNKGQGNNQVQQQQQGPGHRNQHNSNGQFNTKYQRNPQQGPPGGQNNNNHNVNNQQQQQRMGGQGGGWVQRNNNMGPGGPGGPGGMPNQMRGQRGGRMNMRPMNNPNFRQMNPNVIKPWNAGKPIKFENDYDFEQANSKFEELFQKLKVGDGSANPEDKNGEQVNGDAPEKKDDSGNETGAGEQEPEDDSHDSHGYDKTKSFFDNISCEAQTDRKGKPRVDWRQERKLNSETFGVASTRRGGMGYRGRGGHNNYNQAGGYFRQNQNNQHHQGGYRNNNNQHQGNGQGGYRNNYRRHNNMRMNGTNPQSTGIPTASVTKQQPQQATAGPSSGTAGPQTAAQVVAAN